MIDLEELEDSVAEELDRIRLAAISISGIANTLSKAGGASRDVAELYVQAAQISALYISSTLPFLGAEELQTDEKLEDSCCPSLNTTPLKNADTYVFRGAKSKPLPAPKKEEIPEKCHICTHDCGVKSSLG
jgi:hypothetical protein